MRERYYSNTPDGREKRSARRRLPPAQYRELWRAILERDGWRCQCCGSRTNLQIHHIRTRAQGGPDEEENLITLCSQCHRHLHEYIP